MTSFVFIFCFYVTGITRVQQLSALLILSSVRLPSSRFSASVIGRGNLQHISYSILLEYRLNFRRYRLRLGLLNFSMWKNRDTECDKP